VSRRGGLILIVVAAAMLAVPSAAGAATFGADLTQSVDLGPACGSSAGESCSVLTLTKAVSGAAETGSPISGILTSARVKTAGGANTVAVRVLRPDSLIPFTYLNFGPEITIPVPADAGATGGHLSEATNLHHLITAGDRLGIGWVESATPLKYGVFDLLHASCAFRQGASGDHPVDMSVTYNNAGCGFEILVQGTVEADADHDGFGDDTQDQCPSNAATQGPCPTTTPPPVPQHKKKCKKKKHRSADAGVAKKKCKKKHH
jgi:hypothetical protein